MNLIQLLTLILAVFAHSVRSYNCKETWHNEFDCAENCGCGWCKTLKVCLNSGPDGASNSSYNDGLKCSADNFVIAMRCSSGPWDKDDTIILLSVLGGMVALFGSIGLAYLIYRKRCRSDRYTGIA